jgi:16S rRNA (guanine(966)-N(2))-methyltransferase RsmD
VRIIAGVARGHAVRAPRGQSTRPTSDRVREAMFDLLSARSENPGPHAEEGNDVLDLYAGSGAVALEALSRGARHAVLVDKSADALDVARANADALGMRDRVETLRLDVRRAIARLAERGQRFDRVFLDPPYRQAAELVEALTDLTRGPGSLLSDGALVVAEHAKTVELPAQVGGLSLVLHRRHGDTVLSLFRAGPSSGDPPGDDPRDGEETAGDGDAKP